MSFFGHGKKNEMSGTAVREQYDAKINRFLQKFDNSGPKWYQNMTSRSKSDVDALEKLLSWGDGVWTERNSFSVQLSEAKEKLERLETDLIITQRKLVQLEEENQRIKLQHLGEVNHLKTTHTSIIQREQDTHGKEVRKLVSELLVNQDDNVGWTDEKLKFQFRKLQNSINALVSPRNNTQFRMAPDLEISDELDPTGFLHRATKSKIHFLLQSKIWNILYNHFFSAPFGFGILGHGDPQERLFDIFLPWATLLGKFSDSSNFEVYELFNHGQLVNTWRATAFQCINESLAKTSKESQAPATSIAALVAENVDQTTAAIIKVLTQTLEISGNPPPALMHKEVRQIALESQDLAMQFGLHTARLQLLVPTRGDEVRIGAEIHDCEDGDCDRGVKHVVDLVTLPGLQVIGDGRLDHVLKRTLVPCEIYPHQ